MFQAAWQTAFVPGHGMVADPAECGDPPPSRSYEVRLTLRAETLDELGMLEGLNKLKAIMGELLERVDESFLASFPEYLPLAENLAGYLHQEVATSLSKSTEAPINIARLDLLELDLASGTCYEVSVIHSSPRPLRISSTRQIAEQLPALRVRDWTRGGDFDYPR